jgi:hypothetical protein
LTNGAIRVTARNSGGNFPRWGVTLANPERKQGLSIEIGSQGRSVGFGPGFLNFAGPTPKSVPTPAVHGGEETNTLLVLVKGQYVELYVNGEAVGEPFVIEQNLWPAQFNLRVQSKTQASFDFEEVSIWSADNLPVLRPDLVR